MVILKAKLSSFYNLLLLLYFYLLMNIAGYTMFSHLSAPNQNCPVVSCSQFSQFLKSSSVNPISSIIARILSRSFWYVRLYFRVKNLILKYLKIPLFFLISVLLFYKCKMCCILPILFLVHRYMLPSSMLTCDKKKIFHLKKCIKKMAMLCQDLLYKVK